LAGVLRGDIYVQNHCYRADEMALMLDLAREFGFSIRSFHHAVESYKIADLLAQAGTASSVWADWWGFKEEAMDGIQENAALLQQAGARAVIHSDSPSGIQRLNQEAAKAMYAGVRAGIPVTRDQALRWITANPAWVLGIDSLVGTLEPGKVADVVLWSGDPFSVYSQAIQVYNDGWLVFDRANAARRPRTDFELWQVPAPGVDR
jgi:imidazolonepropionase-like amidohydrolase